MTIKGMFCVKTVHTYTIVNNLAGDRTTTPRTTTLGETTPLDNYPIGQLPLYQSPTRTTTLLSRTITPVGKLLLSASNPC